MATAPNLHITGVAPLQTDHLCVNPGTLDRLEQLTGFQLGGIVFDDREMWLGIRVVHADDPIERT